MAKFKARGFVWVENVARPVFVQQYLEGAETRAEAQGMLDELVKKIFSDFNEDSDDPMADIISVGSTKIRQDAILAVQLNIHEVKKRDAVGFSTASPYDSEESDLDTDEPCETEPDNTTVQIGQ